MIIPFLILSGILPLGTADEKGLNIPEDERGRLFSLSGTAPMTKVFNTDRRVVRLTERLLSFFKQMADVLQKSLAADERKITPTKEHISVCDHGDKSWISGVFGFIRGRGWPLQKPSECVTNLLGIPFGVFEVSSEVELRQVIIGRAHKLNRLALKFARLAVKNWTHPEHPMSYPFTEGSVRCEIEHISAIRIPGASEPRWHLSSGYTNEKMTTRLDDFKRSFAHEFHDIQDGSHMPARMRLPINPEVGTVHKIEEKATTSRMWQGGTAEPSSYMPADLKKNMAIRDAKKKVEDHHRQAENSLTESNISIRVLPMVLNLLPLAAFAESGVVMVIYAIVSDVISTVPLLSKGIELLRIDKKRFVSSVTIMGNVTADMNTTVAAETWVVQCGLNEGTRIGSAGILFVVASLGMMVLGIILELAVLRWVKRRREQEQHQDQSQEEIPLISGEEDN